MKTKKSKTEFSANISEEVIRLAVSGDKSAIEQVLTAYEPYIIEQSTVKQADRSETFDEDLAQSLRLALMEAIPNYKEQSE